MNNEIYPLVYIDKETNIKCRIAINRILDANTSSILTSYGKCDQRYLLIVYAVKEWAKNNNLLGKPYLSSYAYSLMVLHYLQSTNPPILPCLQKLFLTKPKDTVEMCKYLDGNQKIIETNVYYEKRADKIKNYMKTSFAANKKMPNELLTEFFIYFGFNFNVNLKTKNSLLRI